MTDTLDFLRKLDNRSKKRLIIKLAETLDVDEPETYDVTSLFGAWEDERSSDEIIREIKESRIEHPDPEKF